MAIDFGLSDNEIDGGYLYVYIYMYLQLHKIVNVAIPWLGGCPDREIFPMLLLGASLEETSNQKSFIMFYPNFLTHMAGKRS